MITQAAGPNMPRSEKLWAVWTSIDQLPADDTEASYVCSRRIEIGASVGRRRESSCAMSKDGLAWYDRSRCSEGHND